MLRHMENHTNRALYIKPKVRKQLFQNTRIDHEHGIRDHCLLRLIFGSTARPIELCRMKTSDFVNDKGELIVGENTVMRGEISFNGSERLFPILDPDLRSALQDWLTFRAEQKWGVTSTGFIDLDIEFFLSTPNKGFAISTKRVGNTVKHNSNSINRIIRKRFEQNEVPGNVESGLRSWTIDRHTEGRSLAAIWKLRGDRDIATVRRLINNNPVRLAALVEKVF